MFSSPLRFFGWGNRAAQQPAQPAPNPTTGAQEGDPASQENAPQAEPQPTPRTNRAGTNQRTANWREVISPNNDLNDEPALPASDDDGSPLLTPQGSDDDLSDITSSGLPPWSQSTSNPANDPYHMDCYPWFLRGRASAKKIWSLDEFRQGTSFEDLSREVQELKVMVHDDMYMFRFKFTEVMFLEWRLRYTVGVRFWNIAELKSLRKEGATAMLTVFGEMMELDWGDAQALRNAILRFDDLSDFLEENMLDRVRWIQLIYSRFNAVVQQTAAQNGNDDDNDDGGDDDGANNEPNPERPPSPDLDDFLYRAEHFGEDSDEDDDSDGGPGGPDNSGEAANPPAGSTSQTRSSNDATTPAGTSPKGGAAAKSPSGGQKTQTKSTSQTKSSTATAAAPKDTALSGGPALNLRPRDPITLRPSPTNSRQTPASTTGSRVQNTTPGEIATLKPASKRKYLPWELHDPLSGASQDVDNSPNLDQSGSSKTNAPKSSTALVVTDHSTDTSPATRAPGGQQSSLTISKHPGLKSALKQPTREERRDLGSLPKNRVTINFEADVAPTDYVSSSESTATKKEAQAEGKVRRTSYVRPAFPRSIFKPREYGAVPDSLLDPYVGYYKTRFDGRSKRPSKGDVARIVEWGRIAAELTAHYNAKFVKRDQADFAKLQQQRRLAGGQADTSLEDIPEELADGDDELIEMFSDGEDELVEVFEPVRDDELLGEDFGNDQEGALVVSEDVGGQTNNPHSSEPAGTQSNQPQVSKAKGKGAATGVDGSTSTGKQKESGKAPRIPKPWKEQKAEFNKREQERKDKEKARREALTPEERAQEDYNREMTRLRSELGRLREEERDHPERFKNRTRSPKRKRTAEEEQEFQAKRQRRITRTETDADRLDTARDELAQFKKRGLPDGQEITEKRHDVREKRWDKNRTQPTLAEQIEVSGMTEEEQIQRATEASLRDRGARGAPSSDEYRASSSTPHVGSSSGQRMTEEEQMRRAIEASLRDHDPRTATTVNEPSTSRTNPRLLSLAERAGLPPPGPASASVPNPHIGASSTPETFYSHGFPSMQPSAEVARAYEAEARRLREISESVRRTGWEPGHQRSSLGNLAEFEPRGSNPAEAPSTARPAQGIDWSGVYGNEIYRSTGLMETSKGTAKDMDKTGAGVSKRKSPPRRK